MLYWKTQNIVSQLTLKVIHEARPFPKGHVLVVRDNYIHVHH